MKLLHAAAAAALAVAPLAASAADVVADFEHAWDYTNGDVNTYYSGGTAADGSSGPNLGVSFVNVSGLSNDPSFAYYSGAPSPLGTAYAHSFGADDRAFMNVLGGAVGALALFYSSPVDVTGAIRAYSGFNGSGALLGSFDLMANAQAYDVWTAVTLAFSGVAYSFDFTGAANVVGLDNIAVTPVPEPSTILLMLAGGGLALRTAQKRRRASPQGTPASAAAA